METPTPQQANHHPGKHPKLYKTLAIISLIIGTVEILASCGTVPPEENKPDIKQVDTTTKESTTSTTTTKDKPAGSKTTTTTQVKETQPPAPKPQPPAPQPNPDPPIGYTEAPGVTDPTPMNKVIKSCGDPTIHERGTTFFTDGTSGWTEQCSAEMGEPANNPPAEPNPAPADVYYPSCKAAQAAGVAPIYQGQPGYRPGLDHDNDGVACDQKATD